jgi:hypothetical protein
MTKIKLVAAAILATGLMFGSQSAQAHCDALDGPVAKAALEALDSGNVNLALPYAPAKAESEIKAAFAQSLKIRTLGAEHKALADRAFIETTVRLHRAGEGAPYTGLQPAGTDFGPAIPAAERALESGNLGQVKALLVEELERALHARFEHALEMQKASKKAPKTADDVVAARERVSAELGFVTYVEGLRLSARGAPGHEHKE